MINANTSAFPTEIDGARDLGLTKREYFAALAMQGILAGKLHLTPDRVALAVTQFADALLFQLEKNKAGG